MKRKEGMSLISIAILAVAMLTLAIFIVLLLSVAVKNNNKQLENNSTDIQEIWDGW